MPWRQHAHEIQAAVAAVIALLPVAVLARLLWHHRLVRLGHRRFFGRELVWEIPTVVLSAVIGGGIAQLIGAEGMGVYAIVGMAAWLGPRGMESMLTLIVQRHLPGERDPPGKDRDTNS